MKLLRLAVPAALILLWSFPVGAASITAAEAAKHVGETATVCGQVASTHFASTSKARAARQMSRSAIIALL